MGRSAKVRTCTGDGAARAVDATSDVPLPPTGALAVKDALDGELPSCIVLIRADWRRAGCLVGAGPTSFSGGRAAAMVGCAGRRCRRSKMQDAPTTISKTRGAIRMLYQRVAMTAHDQSRSRTLKPARAALARGTAACEGKKDWQEKKQNNVHANSVFRTPCTVGSWSRPRMCPRRRWATPLPFRRARTPARLRIRSVHASHATEVFCRLRSASVARTPINHFIFSTLSLTVGRRR